MKKTSFNWRMFLPLTVGMWVVVIGMTTWQNCNLHRLNEARVKEPLVAMTANIAAAFDSGENPMPFLNSTINCYRSIPAYEHLCLSVYQNGNLMYSAGDIIAPEESGNSEMHGCNPDNAFFYNVTPAMNGSVQIYAALPRDGNVSAPPGVNITTFWLSAILLALVLTIALYCFTLNSGKKQKD